MSWKLVPFKSISIRKWLKEIKQRRKEGDRLQRAEVHAAISVAGVAAALAAIAVDNAKKEESSTAKGAAVASAAALVAAQCAKVAEAMGAKREQLSTVMGSAMSGTTASDVLTLTAAAKTCKTYLPFFSVTGYIYNPCFLLVCLYRTLLLFNPNCENHDELDSFYACHLTHIVSPYARM